MTCLGYARKEPGWFVILNVSRSCEKALGSLLKTLKTTGAGADTIYVAHLRLGQTTRGKSNVLADRLRSELLQAYDASLPRLHFANLLCRVLPPASLSTLRAAIYRRIGFAIAPRVAFLSAIRVIGKGQGVYGRLVIGEGTLIGLHPVFNLDDTITIGRNVSLGPSVSIFTSTHLLGPSSRRMNPGVITRPVVIEDGVWVGVGSLILPGVVIGRGSVIGAGSVVTESVPPNMLMVGNPAKPVQELPWPDS